MDGSLGNEQVEEAVFLQVMDEGGRRLDEEPLEKLSCRFDQFQWTEEVHLATHPLE